MKRHSAYLVRRIALGAMMLAWLLTLASSCKSLVFENEGNCDVTYKLKFVYDYNMKWADAFAHEVKSVRVYAFDMDGKLVFSASESGEALGSGFYTMDLPLAPGEYHFVAWCGADNNPGDEHFTVAEGKTQIAKAEELSCYMQRQYEGSMAFNDVNLHPLYFGDINITLDDYSKKGGEYVYIMPLMKDTNIIKIVLQDQSGKSVNVNDYDIRITDSNGSMAADNSLREDETITYLPWATYSGTAGILLKDNYDNGTFTQVSVAQAEFAVPRLMEDHCGEMRLDITDRQNGKKVLSIPLIDYLLLVKSLDAGNIGAQEFLDRQDQYSMIFFLAGGEWGSAAIYINSWRVVLQNQDIGGNN